MITIGIRLHEETMAQRSIDQAPAWVQAAVAAPDQVAAWRELVARYLAGDPTTGIVPWDELEARFAAEDYAQAV
jgi:hypothetical protein